MSCRRYKARHIFQPVKLLDAKECDFAPIKGTWHVSILIEPLKKENPISDPARNFT